MKCPNCQADINVDDISIVPNDDGSICVTFGCLSCCTNFYADLYSQDFL